MDWEPKTNKQNDMKSAEHNNLEKIPTPHSMPTLAMETKQDHQIGGHGDITIVY